MGKGLAVRFLEIGTIARSASQGPLPSRHWTGTKISRRALGTPNEAQVGGWDRQVIAGKTLRSLLAAVVIHTVNARCTAPEGCEERAARSPLRTSGERCAVQQQIGLHRPPHSSLAGAGNG